MKRLSGMFTIILILSVFLAACGGGKSGGDSAPATPSGTTPPPAGTTTVSGQVKLSATIGKPLLLQALQAASGGTVLTDATVELYNADKPEWLYPVAITLTNSSGAYTLSALAHAADNGGSYKDNDPIPTGNYTIISYKVVLGSGTYIAVQPYVKKFDGAIMGNDLIAQDKGTQPVVLSMFGLPKNNDGTFGSATTPLPLNAAIQVTFNTAMARLSVLSAVSIKNSNSAAVQGSWKVSADLLSATFYPASNLTEGKVYTVTVGTGAKNLYGTPISSVVVGKFISTAMDTTPADAIKYLPILTTGVPITTPIQIAANKTLDVNTFTITSTPSIGDKPAVLFSGKGSNPAYPYVYEIVPAGLLQLNTDYAITVSGAKDIVGLTLTTFTFHFKTEASHTAPTVLASSPTGTCAGINDNVNVTFSATMDPATINASTFTVNGVTGIVNSNGTVATFIPSQPLAYGTTYTATVTTGAKDAAGMALASPYTWTFTTAAPPAPPDTTPPTTTASPTGGLYNAAKNVTLTSSETAVIYYTTDGTTPTQNSTKYTAAISITSTCALKFFAVDTAGNVEGSKTETYTIDTIAPTVSSTTPVDQTIGVALNPTITVVFSETMDQASINASTFTVVAGNAAVSGAVAATGTTASFTPTNALAYGTQYTVTVTAGAKDLAGNHLAADKVWKFSTKAAPDTTPPTVSLIGPGNNAQNVPVNTVIQATFSEAIDATTLSATSFSIGGVTGTVSYDSPNNRATFTPSSVLSYSTTYNVVISTAVKDLAGNALAGTYSWSFSTVAPPDTTPPITTAAPLGGSFNAAQLVTLSTNETSTIYYTVDGSTPTTSSPSLANSGSINITTTTTLKFFAKDLAGNSETPQTQTYTMDTVAPVTTAVPAGGTYASAQSVTLTSNEPATIYFTLDGSTPTTSSNSLSTSGTIINITGPIKFFAKDTAGNSETVKTETYIIDTVAPTTTASPAGGIYVAAQNVTLTANEPATIYFTVDGTTPTTSSTVYSTPINIPSTTTLKFFARDLAGNSETPKTAIYTITPLMGGHIQGTPLSLPSTTLLAAATLAGSGTPGEVDGTGTGAGFNGPLHMTTDGSNLYVADYLGGTLRKIVISSGLVSTLVTTVSWLNGVTTDGTWVYFTHNTGISKVSVNGGGVISLATGSYFPPSGITTDGTNLYIAHYTTCNIESMPAAGGAITTIAGSGTCAELNGTGTGAQFNHPVGITTDGTNLYVADETGNVLREININTKAVTTMAATQSRPFGVTTDGTYVYVGSSSGTDYVITRVKISDNSITTFTDPTFNPTGLTNTGTTLFWSDMSHHVIRQTATLVGGHIQRTNSVTIAAIVSTLSGSTAAGSIDGTGTAARFNMPIGIASDGTSLYVADRFNNVVRQIVISSGLVSTLAGTTASGSSNGIGSAARFNGPSGVTTDGTNVFVVDSGNHTIRKIIISSGLVSTLAGSAGASGIANGIGAAARFNSPSDITTDGTNLYVTDQGNHTIRKIVISTGEVSTLAGTAGIPGSSNGTGTAASFNMPCNITTDGANLYVADCSNHTIRMVVISTGEVTTLAGTATLSGSTNGTGADARFSNPCGITTPDGVNLYVVDYGNSTVRKIVIATGEVTTIAGTALSAGSVDGTGAAARFYNPQSITTDGAYLYVADAMNNLIRKVK